MGADGLVLAPVVLFLLVYNFIQHIDINKLQNHTHSADGSVNGIRGWY